MNLSRYYGYVADQLRHQREIYPCYAGILSAHLTPDGKLWDCCILARELGDSSSSTRRPATP